MIRRLKWFERSFPTGMPAHMLPLIMERLRGTPARVANRLTGIRTELLLAKRTDTWSIQENVGHLLDMEPLWQQRLEDLMENRTRLAEADLTNRRTHEANHNAAHLGDLLAGFRRVRNETVCKLADFSEVAAAFTALHPRLGTPMNAVDLANFVAEHDDYHLAQISELLIEAS